MEIFELPYKFESNLKNGSSGNLVNIVNSASGRHLTDGELPTSSRHARHHLLLRTGMGKLLHVISVFLGRAIKLGRRRRPHPFLPLFFPSAPPCSDELTLEP